MAKKKAAMKRRVLVTGAAGRIGSMLVKGLLENNYAVRAMVRKAADAEKLPSGVEVALCDIADAETLEGCCEGVDVVFHLAALLDPAVGKEALQAVNVGGTANLVKEARKAGVKRVVYASTIGVYGNAEPGRPLRGDDAPSPNNDYGATKLLGEEEVRRGGIEFVILRLGVVYGPDFDAGIGPMLKMLDRRMMQYIGSGRNRIPLVHADDVARAFMLAAEKEGAAGETYNIVGAPVTQEEAFRIACKFLGVPAPRFHVPRMLVMFALRGLNSVRGIFGKMPRIMPGYVEFMSLDRAFERDAERMELGWEPRVGAEEGIAQMVQQYRKKQANG